MKNIDDKLDQAEKLDERLGRYHTYRIHASSDMGRELANEYRDDMMKDFGIDEVKFQEIYIQYVNGLIKR